MTTKKYSYLRLVSGELNSNKMYEMVDNENGTFTVFWGRMTGNHDDDKKSAQSKTYGMSEWDSKFKSKLKKGYEDATKYRAVSTLIETKNSKGVSVISNDKHVADLITALQRYAQQQTAAVYKVEAVGVTQEMIDDAQICVDELSNSLKNHFGKKDWSINAFNKLLLKLFTIIPRRMIKVQDHLITDSVKREELERLVGDEQSNIDSMASQVTQNKATTDTTQDDALMKKQQTVLDSLGLDMELVTDAATIKLVKEKSQEHANRVLRIFKVINRATQRDFDNCLKHASNKKTDLLWHGSRNQNWWFIVQQGLKIRPSGAVHTGSLLGHAVYFANMCIKSLGYTDTGKWVNGKNTTSLFMGLYEVNVGCPLEMKNKAYAINNPKQELFNKGFNSVHAFKGCNMGWGTMKMDEITIYNSNQSTIKYLIEFAA